MKLLRLPRSKVQLGKPLPWNVRDETTRLLLSRGHIIENEKMLDELLQRGAFVDVEEARAVAQWEQAQAEKEGSTFSAVHRAPNMFASWDASAEELHKLMGKVPEIAVPPGKIAEFAAWITDMVDKNVDVALYHMVRQENSHLYYYGYNHAIHVAVLCLLLARRLHWSPARTNSLMHAALTMNMSIFALQGKMAEQDEPMRESQRAQIRAHPAQAIEWLQQAGIQDEDWLNAIAQHHEREDGTGYPEGRTSVTEIASALRAADVFMAKISPRKLRLALPIQEAARQLFQEHHGDALAGAVIKEFGIYPPGEVVRLASGEIGVVAHRTDQVKCPIVAAITDPKGHATVHTTMRDTSQAAYAIHGIVADKSMVARMPPERVYGYTTLPPTSKPTLGSGDGASPPSVIT